MTLAYDVPGIKLYEGDAVTVLRSLPESSVDAVVTDPPYGLEFMGKEWDKLATPKAGNLGGFADGNKPSFERVKKHLPAMQAWHYAWAVEALRVMKPGAHLVAFGGTRTFHRLTCALEDAGFEIRDCLMWVYGSGFPKSLDVSKAIDKAAGAEREVIGKRADGRYAHGFSDQAKRAMGGVVHAATKGFAGEMGQITEPATDAAKQWDGWGTALKPAWEPIILARKPLSEPNVAANVLKWGTGAINVDGCRIETGEALQGSTVRNDIRGGAFASGHKPNPGDIPPYEQNMRGRWPANVILDEEAGAILDAQTGELASGQPMGMKAGNNNKVYGQFAGGIPVTGFGDAGGASRFFYCAKADRTERDAGLEGFEKRPLLWSSGEQNPGSFQAEGTEREARNYHPTVKPIDLMRWLIRLVTPKGGGVLDLFMGSGSTGVACVLEDFPFIGCDQESGYVEISKARIRHAQGPLFAMGGEA